MFICGLGARRSEGLQTVRVLAPIPKQAMQWTPGFPTPVKSLCMILKIYKLLTTYIDWL